MKLAITSVMQDVPAASREELQLALSESFAAPAARVLDGHTRVRAALVAAIEEQIAPLADPRLTNSGRSFLEEIDVDADSLRDDLAHVAIRCIEQVGSDFPALTPLVTQLNADGIIEIEEALAAKVDRILSAIEQWQQAPPVSLTTAGRPARQPRAFGFSPDDMDRIADALLAVPSIYDTDTRNTILNMLPSGLRDSIRRSSLPRVEVNNMVRACPHYEHGLRDLVRAIRSVERDSLPMRQLDDVILEIADEAEAAAEGAEDESGTRS
ncbi:MAG TPA: hypothetical protein VF070_16735 [Streptosporangiaceae bacterium]